MSPIRVQVIFEAKPTRKGSTFILYTNLQDNTAQGEIWVPNGVSKVHRGASNSFLISLPKGLDLIPTLFNNPDVTDIHVDVVLTVTPSYKGNVVWISTKPQLDAGPKDFFVAHGAHSSKTVLLPLNFVVKPDPKPDLVEAELDACIGKSYEERFPAWALDPLLFESVPKTSTTQESVETASKKPIEEGESYDDEKPSSNKSPDWLKSPFKGRLRDILDVAKDKAGDAALSREMVPGVSRQSTPSAKSRAGSVSGWSITAEDDVRGETGVRDFPTVQFGHHGEATTSEYEVHGSVNADGSYSLVDQYGNPLHPAQDMPSMDDTGIHGQVNLDGTFSLVHEHLEIPNSPEAAMGDDSVHGIINLDGTYSLVDGSGNPLGFAQTEQVADDTSIHGQVNADGSYSFFYEDSDAFHQDK